MSKKPVPNPEDMTQDELRKMLGLEDAPEYADNYSGSEAARIIDEMDSDELANAWDDFDDLMDRLPGYLQYLGDHISKDANFASIGLDFRKSEAGEYINCDAFSDDTINSIEEYFLGVYTQSTRFAGDIDELILAVGLYLGEAAVVRLKGEWLVWDKKGDVDFGKPVLGFWLDDDYGLKLNPFEMVVILMESGIEKTLLGSLNAIEQALIED